MGTRRQFSREFKLEAYAANRPTSTKGRGPVDQSAVGLLVVRKQLIDAAVELHR